MIHNNAIQCSWGNGLYTSCYLTHYILICASACKMNVHIRCHRNVANNCGVNAKEMAQILKDMGLTGNKLTESMRVKKVGKYI